MQIAGMEICTIDQLDPKVHKLAYISTSYSWWIGCCRRIGKGSSPPGFHRQCFCWRKGRSLDSAWSLHCHEQCHLQGLTSKCWVSCLLIIFLLLMYFAVINVRLSVTRVRQECSGGKDRSWQSLVSQASVLPSPNTTNTMKRFIKMFDCHANLKWVDGAGSPNYCFHNPTHLWWGGGSEEKDWGYQSPSRAIRPPVRIT